VVGRGGYMRRITDLVIARSGIGHARFRVGLFLAACLLVVLTLPFLPPDHWLQPRQFGILAAVTTGLLGLALIPSVRALMAGNTGVIAIAWVTLLASFTGGGESPYTVLFLIALLYGAIFHDRRRLVTESVFLTVMVALMFTLNPASHHHETFGAALRLGALLIMGAAVHGLVAQLRATTRKLEASEQKYRSLVEYNPDAVHTYDLQGRFTSANPAAAMMSGYATDELAQMRRLPMTALIAPDRIEETLVNFSASIGGRPQHFETAILDRYGNRVELQVVTVPIVVDGEVIGIYSVSKDVTDRKLAERLLRERAAQQTAVGRLGQSALVTAELPALLDEATRLVSETMRASLVGVFELRGVNQAQLVAGVGWRGDAAGNAMVPTTEPYDIARAVESAAPYVVSDYVMADHDRPVPLVEDHQAGSGMTVAIRLRETVYGVLAAYDAQPREYTDDERTFLQTVANVLASAIGRRQAEQQLLQAQKLQAVGQLAGGIAHDFNNLLTAVIGYCELLEPHVVADPVGSSHLHEALAAGERARALVDQILTFSRGRVSSTRSCNLNQVVTDMSGLLRRLIPPGIELRMALAENIGEVRAEPSQLEQVVLNLVVNARDAMPEGGLLRVTTSDAEMDAAAAAVAGVRPGRYTLLTVEDDGTGIDASTAARLFEPFFTTKPPGKGTGLGLSTVYGIVTGAGGQILVESQPGRGSRFLVHLPVVHSDVPARPVAPLRIPARTTPGAEGGATILVVEDQAAVRSLVIEILQQRGHAVLQAANGLEAREVAAAHGGAVDLLITDVVMPQLGGPELAALLRATWPHLRVLYMSGYSARPELLSHDASAAFLAKPFGAADLVRHIDEMLARPTAGAQA
jgi:two-component system cell cycle sensor histidine kinase/response regulator CckA